MIEEIETLRQKNAALEKLVVELTKENMELRRQQELGSELFADWLLKWLDKKRMTIKENTFNVYKTQIKMHIEPYFRARNLTLGEITPNVLEKYYYAKYLEGLSGETIKKHHSNIHAALKSAVKNRLILCNPADLAERPHLLKFSVNALTSVQLNRVFASIKNTKYFTPIYIAGVMGLRRSEVIGLRWSDIDFENRKMTIQHTAVQYIEDHHSKLLFTDMPKTKTSLRTLPIPEKLFEHLSKIKRKQVEYYMHNQKTYCKDYLKYVCVDNMGKLIKPSQLSGFFRDRTKKLGYNCRFHDLRHTCASLLIQQGVPMKSVSGWLGHSSISVTSDVYVHLVFQDKIDIAKTLDDILE